MMASTDLVGPIGRRLLVVAMASAAVFVAFSLPSSASAQGWIEGCSGSSGPVNSTDVRVSWYCEFQTPEFWIIGWRAGVGNVKLEHVRGFEGFKCGPDDERNYREYIELGEPVQWMLHCHEPVTPKPRPTAQTSAWVSASTGVVRSAEPACKGSSPLRFRAWTLKVPDPGTWDPDSGFEHSWLHRFPLKEPCGTSEGSAWLYAPPSQSASASGAVKAQFSCRVDCTVRARGTIRVPRGSASAAKARTIKLKRLTKPVSAGQTRTFRWKLNKSQRKRLKGHRSKAKITARSVDATGAKAVVTQRLKVR